MVTAVGADAPEIASAVAAIAAGHEDTGVGVVVGSNVFNLAGLLGLSALIAGPLRIHRHGLVFTGGVAVLMALVGTFVAVGWLPGVAGLLLALLVFVPYLVLSGLHSPARARLPAVLLEAVSEEQQDARRDEFARPATTIDALAIVPALAAVVGGAAGMVAAAQSLGDRWDLAAVALDAYLVAARAFDCSAHVIERERALHGGECFTFLEAALAHDRESRRAWRDPHGLLAEDYPAGHYAARSANFA